MTRCSQAGCLSTDLTLYRRYLGHGLTLLCDPCRDRLVNTTGMSLTPVERRETDLPVLTERRRSFRPAWLSHLRARDETRLSA